MLIERETRPGRCRYCGEAVVWGRRGSTGRPVAFTPPLHIVPTLFSALTPSSQLVEVDKQRTKLHVQTCTAFAPRLASGWGRR